MTKKKKTNSEGSLSTNKPALNEPSVSYDLSSPAVSVIIPLYNAAEYIGECLDSILQQTFQDFEVIVVDDCSTDDSMAIVETYLAKFGGRLKLTKTSTNSGGGSVPRNKGFFFSKGEYVFFMKAEDFILLNALETLYSTAKKNNADVVYLGAYYDLKQPDDVYVRRDVEGQQAISEGRQDKPSLSGMDIKKNLQKILNEGSFWNTWTGFVRRDFLIKNEIVFPEVKFGGDYLWRLQICCYPKRLWRIPTPLYFHRSSVDGKETISMEQAPYLSLAFVDWLKALKELSSRLSFLRDNPAYCYEASKNYFKLGLLDKLAQENGYLNVHELYRNLCCHDKELSDPTLPFFFSASGAAANAPEVSVSLTTPPLISVIIPLYNSEKHIGKCLESILVQTFRAFEVILVDDCSTDSSCKIVENYMPMFGGRLKLYHMDENTGSGALPRNKGLLLSRGKYVYNMDNDDMLTETALEELYTLAVDYNADVVYCEKFYEISPDGKHKRIQCHQEGGTVDAPTLESDDLKDRVQSIIDDRYYVVPWLKLIRRNLLIEHDIIFPGLKISDDNIWHQGILFYAKRILRVPNIIYNYRLTETSILRTKKTPQVRMNFWIDPVLRGLKYLDKLMDGQNFFKENPYYRYLVLKKFISVRFLRVVSSSKELTEDVVYETIKSEYGKYFGEHDVLIPSLCTYICEQNKVMAETKKESQLILSKEDKYKEFISNQAAEIERLRNKLDSMASLLDQPICEVSVIIPLYNAAKYVGECLESLLIQTFQDFEVIVVDDCSTDNSVKVVESYMAKFNGRLKLMKTEKNSGGGGYVPRNIGFKLARGKYVYFADADDFLLGSALETFYTMAEEYNTDIVYTANHYCLDRPNEVHILRDGKAKELAAEELEDQILLTVDDNDKILNELIFNRGFSTPWAHFVRRNFLLQNNITFPEILKAGDYIWAINMYCYAKRFLRLITPLYFYRHYNVNSVSQSKTANTFSNWVLSFNDYARALGELSSKIEILRKNPSYSYEASKRYFGWCLNRTKEARQELNDVDMYETLYHEFSKLDASNSLMMPFFFTLLDAAKKSRETNAQDIKQLKKELEQLKES